MYVTHAVIDVRLAASARTHGCWHTAVLLAGNVLSPRRAKPRVWDTCCSCESGGSAARRWVVPPHMRLALPGRRVLRMARVRLVVSLPKEHP